MRGGLGNEGHRVRSCCQGEAGYSYPLGGSRLAARMISLPMTAYPASFGWKPSLE